MEALSQLVSNNGLLTVIGGIVIAGLFVLAIKAMWGSNNNNGGNNSSNSNGSATGG